MTPQHLDVLDAVDMRLKGLKENFTFSAFYRIENTHEFERMKV